MTIGLVVDGVNEMRQLDIDQSALSERVRSGMGGALCDGDDQYRGSCRHHVRP